MALWQLDIVGGAFLAGGTEAKVVTGVDDHSRYCVIASVVARSTGRAVCLAFAAALRAFGVPGEVLTDNHVLPVLRQEAADAIDELFGA